MPRDLDLILAADVLYDAENLPLLQQFRTLAGEVLVADSRVRNLAEQGYSDIGSGQARTWPDLGEAAEFSQVTFYAASNADQ